MIAGFEPLDVLQAILMLIRQINEGRAEVENEFTRAVTREGNLKAQAMVSEVLELRRSFEWRGLGEVPYSALKIRPAYALYDAETRYGIGYKPVAGQQGLRMRRDSARREKAAGLQSVRHGVHAGEPAGFVHGVVGRCLCGALQLWTI